MSTDMCLSTAVRMGANMGYRMVVVVATPASSAISLKPMAFIPCRKYMPQIRYRSPMNSPRLRRSMKSLRDRADHATTA